jgi:predicted nucleotidyltransferase
MNTHTSQISNTSESVAPDVRPIPWLDSATNTAVREIICALAQDHPEAQAVILFGSVARREERSLDDAEPSDVDLLLLLDAHAVDPDVERLSYQEELALRATVGEADYRWPAPRVIQVLFVYRTLAGWDPLFIENVARDGILLWSRGALPDPLAAVTERKAPPMESLVPQAAIDGERVEN